MCAKKQHPKTIPPTKRQKVFDYWLKNPNLTNKDLVEKFKLSHWTITQIQTQGLRQCKQK
jgi:hypothetical protein